MSHQVRDKYIEPMAKGEKPARKRDSGYGGTGSDRSSHRRTGSRKSIESTSGGSGGYAEPDINLVNQQRWDMSQLQNTLLAKDNSIDRFARLNYDLEKDLTEANNEKRRLRRERDAERKQSDELRASLALAYKEIERLQKETKHLKRESGKDSNRKPSNKSGSKENWKEMPVPLYRNPTPPPVPEMPRSARPTSSGSRPTGQRRMSTYTVTPINNGP